MKNYFYLILTFCVGIILFYAGCKDTISGNKLDNRTIPDSNVSFSQNILPVFIVKCTNSGCHDNETIAGGISLTSWANTTADPNVIFPGKPGNSSLVWAIERQSNIQPMPPLGYPPLTPAQIKGIITWIKEGAKDN
ncbi:MAG TPA: hypothetical protein ENI76_04890 [Ignavibacteria bacterium]|nr:hypothetical protein [Ignavibacteria bacterium]